MISVSRWGFAAVALVAVSLPANAQSLGEVSKLEEARRAEVKSASKVYSNASLQPGETSAAAGSPGESCYMSISRNRCVTGDELLTINSENKVNAEKKLEEPYWRDKAETLRGRLEKAQAEIATMSATAADESRTPAERAIAAKRLAASQSDRQFLEQQWLKLEKGAAESRMPLAWLEPIPQLSSRSQR